MRGNSRTLRLLSIAASAVAVVAIAGACSDSDGDGADTTSADGAGNGEHTVIFARHAESWSNIATEDNPPPLPVSNPADFLGPDGDLPLTEKGAAQAQALAESLKDEVDDIYASSQVRTFQTARAVSIVTDIPVQATWDLREIGDASLYKDWMEGKSLDTPTGPDNDKRSFNQMNDTFLEFWDQFVEDNKGEDGTSLIVTHGGVMALFAAPLCGDNPKLTPELEEKGFDYTEQLKATLHPDGTVTCTMWAGHDIAP